jgi:hypothetical protein
MTSGMSFLLDSIFGKQNLDEISLEEIHSVINEFPSFNAAHFLLSKKLRLENDQAYLKQAMKTALYFNNPVWLQSLLEEDPELPVTSESFLITDHHSAFEKVQASPTLHEEYESPEEAITEPVINYQPSTINEEYESPEEAIIEPHISDQLSTINEEYQAPEETITVNEKYEEPPTAETINEEYAESESPINHQPSTINEEYEAPEETLTVNEKYEEPPTAEIINEEYAESESPIHDQPSTINEEYEVPVETVTINEKYETGEPAQAINQKSEETEFSINYQPSTINEPPEAEETNTESPINYQPSTINEPPEPEETITESPIYYQPSTINEPPEHGINQPVFDAKKAESIVFEPYHMIDYFASQGINLILEDHPTDQFGRQLKSFTNWLKVMKRLPGQTVIEKTDEREAERIRRFAASSIEERDILTETMAEVLAKQGMYENAIALYQKLSLIYPPKSAYFASRIEQLKASLS